MKNHAENLTANLSPEKAVERIQIDENLRELAKRIREEGGARDSERIKEALRLVEQSYSLTREEDPREKYLPYVEVIQEELFGNKEPFFSIPPKPEDLTDEWFEKMYPDVDNDHQRPEDLTAGRICFRPPSENKRAKFGIVSKLLSRLDRSSKSVSEEHSVMGAYFRSIKAEAEFLKESESVFTSRLLISNADIKIDDNVFSIARAAKGGLLIQLYGLLRSMEDNIVKKFKKSGFKIPAFQVLLTPVSVSRQFMEQNPNMSKLDFSVLSETPLLDESGKETTKWLTTGGVDLGGAGAIGTLNVKDAPQFTMFRLSIVFYKDRPLSIEEEKQIDEIKKKHEKHDKKLSSISNMYQNPQYLKYLNLENMILRGKAIRDITKNRNKSWEQ